MEEFKGDFCRLHFRVKSNTTFGQAIGVSGSCYVLGMIVYYHSLL